MFPTDLIIKIFTNTAGHFRSSTHKRSPEDESYHSCPQYGTVSTLVIS